MTGDCCRWTLAASLTVALAMVAVPVKAMQFHAVSLDEHVEIIEAMGPIISGDTDRLRSSCGTCPRQSTSAPSPWTARVVLSLKLKVWRILPERCMALWGC